jgi:hypothetical protein
MTPAGAMINSLRLPRVSAPTPIHCHDGSDSIVTLTSRHTSMPTIAAGPLRGSCPGLESVLRARQDARRHPAYSENFPVFASLETTQERCGLGSVEGLRVINGHVRRWVRAIIVRQRTHNRFLLRCRGVNWKAAANCAYFGRGAWVKSNRPGDVGLPAVLVHHSPGVGLAADPLAQSPVPSYSSAICFNVSIYRFRKVFPPAHHLSCGPRLEQHHSYSRSE